jgi:hypothetical protein
MSINFDNIDNIDDVVKERKAWLIMLIHGKFHSQMIHHPIIPYFLENIQDWREVGREAWYKKAKQAKNEDEFFAIFDNPQFKLGSPFLVIRDTPDVQKIMVFINASDKNMNGDKINYN